MRLGPNTMASAMRGHHCGPEPIGAGSVLAEKEVLDGDSGGAPPSRQEDANEHEAEEEDGPKAREPGKSGEGAFPGRHCPAPDLDVDPHLQEDAERRGPHHVRPEPGGDPGPEDEFAGADGHADHHGPGPRHPPEALLAQRQVGALEVRNLPKLHACPPHRTAMLSRPTTWPRRPSGFWCEGPGGEGILPSHAPTGAHVVFVGTVWCACLCTDAPCGA